MGNILHSFREQHCRFIERMEIFFNNSEVQWHAR